MTEHNWSTGAPGVTVERHQPGFVAVLRLRLSDGEDLEAIGQELGIALPSDPNRTSGSDPRALWIGPGEWMIVANQAWAPTAHARNGRTIHLADVTDGRVSYAITGARAADLLAKGCTLDFHPRVFPTGRCAQSALAQVFVTIERPATGPTFILYADASLARHLDLWFEDAVLEFRTGKTK